MKATLIIFATITVILLASTFVYAQPGLPSTPDQAPIDGGLSLLALAGGVYAYKKLNRRESK